MLFNRILITGANGLLGQALVQRMGDSSDYTVLATGRAEKSPLESSPCDYARLDVTDPDGVSAVFQEFDPNVVVNCAAYTDVAACEDNRNEAWTVNARAVKRLAKQCQANGTHLAQISCASVFNGTRGPHDENARPDPVNYYGRTKLAAENAVREAGRSNWTLVRTSLPYGAGRALSRSNLALRTIERLSQGDSLRVADDRYCTPTYVVDLAAGIERLIEYETSGLYHLSGRERLSHHEFAHKVAEALGFDASFVRPVPSDSLDDVDRPSDTSLIILRAETELDFDPRSLDDALRDLKERLSSVPVS